MVMHAKSGGRLEIMGLLLGNAMRKPIYFACKYFFLHVKRKFGCRVCYFELLEKTALLCRQDYGA